MINVRIELDNANGPENDEVLATMQIVNVGPSVMVNVFPDDRLYEVKLTDKIGTRTAEIRHRRERGWEELVKSALSSVTAQVRYDR